MLLPILQLNSLPTQSFAPGEQLFNSCNRFKHTNLIFKEFQYVLGKSNGLIFCSVYPPKAVWRRNGSFTLNNPRIRLSQKNDFELSLFSGDLQMAFNNSINNNLSGDKSIDLGYMTVKFVSVCYELADSSMMSVLERNERATILVYSLLKHEKYDYVF
ncbi:MAG: hypothetical protein MHMPM18_003527 [Marteilia pararefringens]